MHSRVARDADGGRAKRQGLGGGVHQRVQRPGRDNREAVERGAELAALTESGLPEDVQGRCVSVEGAHGRSGEGRRAAKREDDVVL